MRHTHGARWEGSSNVHRLSCILIVCILYGMVEILVARWQASQVNEYFPTVPLPDLHIIAEHWPQITLMFPRNFLKQRSGDKKIDQCTLLTFYTQAREDDLSSSRNEHYNANRISSCVVLEVHFDRSTGPLRVEQIFWSPAICNSWVARDVIIF